MPHTELANARLELTHAARLLGERLIAVHKAHDKAMGVASIQIPCDCAVYRERYGDLAWLAWIASGCALTGECR